MVFLGRKPRKATWLRSKPIAKPLYGGTIRQRVMHASTAVSQLLWPDKDREERFSLGENHEKVLGFPGFPARGTGCREQLCAAFFTESRMQFDGTTKPHRKSGFGLHQLRNRALHTMFDLRAPRYINTFLLILWSGGISYVRPFFPPRARKHRVPGGLGFDGMAASGSVSWSTPLAKMP